LSDADKGLPSRGSFPGVQRKRASANRETKDLKLMGKRKKNQKRTAFLVDGDVTGTRSRNKSIFG